MQKSQFKRNFPERKPIPRINSLGQKSLNTHLFNPSKKAVRAIALAAMMIIPTAKGAALGGIEPAPMPPRWATVEDARATYMHGHDFDKSKNGFDHFRIAYKLPIVSQTNNGPVILAERKYPQGTTPDAVRIGIAQRVKLPEGFLADIGYLSPQMGKGNLSGSDYGLILMQQKTPLSFEAHLQAGGEKNRFSLGTEFGKYRLPSPEISYGTKGYFDNTPTIRIGANGLEHALGRAGINLGKYTAGFGINLPENKKWFADMYLIKPTNKGRMLFGLSATVGERHNTSIKGFVIINFKTRTQQNQRKRIRRELRDKRK
ncbi:MAG: hypothetical protein NTY48_03600 [Candidatus Diapherotrites archaeon]|nr:hypothetical protein [Candidatus Diapherotrites archaeon]